MNAFPASQAQSESSVATKRWVVTGVVQGVGFRPFVYRLARLYGLDGWVQNRLGQVEIRASGSAGELEAFAADLLAKAPAIARPAISLCENVESICSRGFNIHPSAAGEETVIHLPVDYAVCTDCLAEMRDPKDRRYRYPFINCTQCGPRYTLIRALPYDRPNTSMDGFQLCASCLREYQDPDNRRFHAEPIACPVCGPRLEFRRDKQSQSPVHAQQALSACCEALRDGLLVAVKGVGGYHLMCDAANSVAIQRLRERKPRPDKPLAVMFPESDDLAELRANACVSDQDEALLRSSMRPIVLVKKSPEAMLASGIAPGLGEIGAMLPYSPLHHLLLGEFGRPLVATSANVSGEPVLTTEQDVSARLGHIVQAYLNHNRPIVRPADDPVYRIVARQPRPLRMGRGSAPVELCLPGRLAEPVLAVGAHMKNTVCLAWDNRAVVSPHIGDMDTLRSVQVFEQSIHDLQTLYAVKPRAIICDLHPDYATTRWAARQGLPVHRVQHHAAHASALIGEQDTSPGTIDSLMFTWDGVGLGDDRTLWGGEALLGRPGSWERVGSMRPLRIPGAARAGREPWRSAVAMALDCGVELLAQEIVAQAHVAGAPEDAYALISQAWAQAVSAPLSSAVGRLFDAAAALAGVCLHAEFEGQGPMRLEALAVKPAEPLELALDRGGDGIWRTDWRPLMGVMIKTQLTVAERASIFHASLARALVQQACAVRREHAVTAVGLCGGVFQNRRLTEACGELLDSEGFDVYLGKVLPVNDAGISFGQVVEYAARDNSGTSGD